MACCAALLAATLAGCGEPEARAPTEAQRAPAQQASSADYVGSQRCQACHAEVYQQWSGSHHALAIQPASTETVLADINASGSVISAHEGRLYATLENASGERDRFALTHTFGVEPLQQYLVDAGDGKRQVIRESWDSRPAEAGGQRWFLQYAGEAIPPGDVLHWTAIAQNWNSMCGDCHSTAFKKGYDWSNDRFDSTWAELSVGCEACHGPGSAHVQNPQTQLPGVEALSDPNRQPDVCAPCHARRGQLAEGYQPGDPLLDYYLPELLNPPLYHPDGRILDEVYVYGSFLSSRMHQAGVTCSNCHNPHSATLAMSGDAVCLQCHSAAGNPEFPTLERKNYARTEHHFHPVESAGARCISCHMGSRIYMGNDERHDHGFRVPRRDAPSICSTCHANVEPESLERFLPPRADDHFARVFAQRTSDEAGLLAIANDVTGRAIVRATALSRLRSSTSMGATRATLAAARDGHPLVRRAALGNLEQLQPQRRIGVLKRLLEDPVRAVRIEAARVALGSPGNARSTFGATLDAALDEYRQSLLLFAERAESQTGLAYIAAALGDLDTAESALNKALEINPRFVPALVNFADLLRHKGDDAQAGPYLERAVRNPPHSPAADQAYALWLTRQGRAGDALTYLERAHLADPLAAQGMYLYAVALNSLGRTREALELLDGAVDSAAYSEPVHFLHATILRDLALRDSSRLAAAAAVAESLVQRQPTNSSYRALYDQLTGGEFLQ